MSLCQLPVCYHLTAVVILVLYLRYTQPSPPPPPQRHHDHYHCIPLSFEDSIKLICSGNIIKLLNNLFFFTEKISADARFIKLLKHRSVTGCVCWRSGDGAGFGGGGGGGSAYSRWLVRFPKVEKEEVVINLVGS